MRDTTTRSNGRAKAEDGLTSRLPPFSNEAEIGVLGCILLDPQCISECIEKIPTPETFYDLRHQLIYSTMLELFEDNTPIDLIVLYERLKTWGNAEQVGGLAYIGTLSESVPSAANLSYYIDIVKEKFLMRRMIKACTETVSKLYTTEENIETVLDECEREILGVNQSRVNQTMLPIRELLKEAINQIEISSKRNGELIGLPTGLIDFDRMTGGLQQPDVIVIAARPGIGKTSLAMNIAETVAVDNKIPVGVFSLEMSNVQLIKRMIYTRAKVNGKAINEGFIADRDYPKITSATAQMMKAPLYIDDTGGLSILQLRAKARRMYQQYGIRLFVIDYLQLLHGIARKRYSNRQEEVAEISSGIKSLAKELKVPVLVLAQLNREVDRENNRIPRLSDLRESGAIEQDADLVCFLQEETGDGLEFDESSQIANVVFYIRKNRNGPVGKVPLTFFKTFTKFESRAKILDADVPPQITNNPQQQNLV